MTTTAKTTAKTSIAERLAERRRALELSQRALAELLGVDRTTVWRWETGRDQPSLATTARWARALGAELELDDDTTTTTARRRRGGA